eukprot:6209042-Pyramimonas_sp.AAC.1
MLSKLHPTFLRGYFCAPPPFARPGKGARLVLGPRGPCASTSHVDGLPPRYLFGRISRRMPTAGEAKLGSEFEGDQREKVHGP